jgi:hypothetical protein
MPIDSKDTVTDFLTEWAQNVTDMIRKNLESKGEYYRRSALAPDIAFLPVEVTNEGYKLIISMPDYAKFIDKGVKGNKSGFSAPDSEYEFRSKMPPIEPLVLWIKRRGDINISLTEKQNRKISSLKSKKIKKALKSRSFDYKTRQVAFAMAKNIQKKGITATHFYSEIVNSDLIEELTISLGAKYGEMFEAEIVAP